MGFPASAMSLRNCTPTNAAKDCQRGNRQLNGCYQSMNPSPVDKIANAVLYEGYILYPYRASSRKNRQRFTFGRVYPQAYGEAQNGAEPFAMRTECLLRSRGETSTLEVRVRFLHPMTRTVGLLSAPVAGTTSRYRTGFFFVGS